MTNTIYNITKRNIFLACLFACVVAFAVNVAFSFVGGFVSTGSNVNVANNLVDVAQLAVYVATKLKTFKKLDKFDLPFIVANLFSIAI